MAENKGPNQNEPVRLVDDNDRSLTLVNNHVDGRDNGQGLSSEPNDEFNSEANYDEEYAPEYTYDEDYDEETAMEYANGIGIDRRSEDAETAEANPNDVAAGRGVGTFAIVLSILSLFFLPILLGAAGIVVGFISRRVGSNAMGNWAIGIGAVSIIMTVFFSPFF
ncbi:DUF4190 domain-containing protein [Halalkalibacter sp. APA_J-10(15)]|uniref:DUF4190 domain-containing protein n=1 Tax=unclassified Halalkalibacter TaxID=2893063 RepID=UPI001FF1AA76|nr:DUF4190 domain-containing protein [Halalkalibacter sp. APA_J-10(15)]MCK0471533.1 DUF4190 domain-containing protein [Halalkalibacter sp. APA_J-10(15)]